MPRYEHDCDTCIYQGIVDQYDAYFHPYRDSVPDGSKGVMVYRWATDNEVDGYGLYISQTLTEISRDPRVNGMLSS